MKMTDKKNIGTWCRRRMIWMAAAVFFMALPLYVHASDAKILSTVVSDGNIYVYIKGISELPQDCVVQIGNHICQKGQLSSASMSGSGISMRTLVLIDNSKSIPDKNHADIQEILEGLIAASPENEQFKIGTFSDQLTYLCDYTNDKEALLEVAEGLTYNDQDTYLSDILYDEISELKMENTNAYTRLIVFADGADDKAIGFTNDEVRSYIGENAYPVYTVGIPAKNNAAKLEALFSFSRAANSEYFLLDGSLGNDDITGSLSADQSGICLRISPDESLKDGSAKKILLKLGGDDGNAELTANVNMPFGSGIDKASMEEDEEEEAEEEKRELPTLGPGREADTLKKEEDSKVSLPFVLFICIAAVAVIAVTVLFIAVIPKKKKANELSVQESAETSNTKDVTQMSDRTEISGADTVMDDARGLWRKTADNYLVLKDLDLANIMWKVPIMDKIRIGRNDTQDIVIENDKKVSREHCEIILRGNLLYLSDCNSSNGTFYEGVKVYGETPIMSGGTVGIGAHRYQVDLVQE